MVSIPALLLPLVLSAVAVFLVSSVLHMALKYHRADFQRIPNEAEAIAGLRRAALPPGLYQFPHCDSMKDMGSPAMLEKLRLGPVGILAVMPSRAPQMGKHLGLWFAYILVVSLFVAYLTGRTLGLGTAYLEVFRVAGTVAFLAYGVAHVVDSIWHAFPWSNTLRAIVDGLIYSLVTAGVFGWLWPR